MPKENIDYSNTIIYKIYCNDSAITDTYVGHTTNFVVRKYSHKNACNNSKNVLKIYKIIRENGGWDNWNMVEIAKYNCNDSTEARIKEQLHYEELKSTLNSCPPYVDKLQYYCVECDLQCSSPKQFDKHIKCSLHTKNQIKPNNEQTIINKSKFCPKFYCEKCHYGTSKKSSYDDHLISKRHNNLISKRHNNLISINNILPKFCSGFICHICSKEYKDNSGLWRHNKKCIKIQQTVTPQNINVNISDLQNDHTKQQQLIEYLLKENSEFKQLMIEQNKQMLELVKNIAKETVINK